MGPSRRPHAESASGGRRLPSVWQEAFDHEEHEETEQSVEELLRRRERGAELAHPQFEGVFAILEARRGEHLPDVCIEIHPESRLPMTG